MLACAASDTPLAPSAAVRLGGRGAGGGGHYGRIGICGRGRLASSVLLSPRSCRVVRAGAPGISCVLASADRVDTVERRLDLQGHADSWVGLCRAGLTHLLDLPAKMLARTASPR